MSLVLPSWVGYVQVVGFLGRVKKAYFMSSGFLKCSENSEFVGEGPDGWYGDVVYVGVCEYCDLAARRAILDAFRFVRY